MKILDIPQSGKRGNTVSYKHGPGQFQRRLVIPFDPKTPIQNTRRQTMKSVRLLWGSLTDPQYAAWEAAAQETRSERRLGQPALRRGYTLFVKINFTLVMLGLPPLLDPPALPEFSDNPVSELTITNINGSPALKLSVTGQPAQYVVVMGTKPRSPGTTYVDHFTILGVLPAPVDGVSDITAMFAAKYGHPPAGSRVFIEVFQQINGWQEHPKRLSARVPTP